MKNDNENKPSYLPIFMCLGLSVGMAIGAASDNIPIGMCLGMSVGVSLGAVLDAKKRKEGDGADQTDSGEESGKPDE